MPSDPSKDYYFIHRETGRLEPVLVEYGFIDSPKDDVVQLKNNLPNYVEAVVKAVAEYIGVPYTNPGVSDSTYVVKRGDSLYSIAKSFGISVEALKNANGVNGNLITIGQTLVIPSISDKTPGDYVIYTVKKGDSLWKIANSYGISVNDIVDYNNLDTTLLSIGQQLLIPTITPSLDDNLTYIVKNGDSLWSVAKKYNISVDELKNYNNLMTNMLSIGQVLMIPGTDKYKTYIVKSGDSLYKIARENNVSINDLITLNNLSNTVLQIGQQLLIP